MGALLASIISLPMGLAFGVQSGLGAQAGIFTAIVLAFVASLFGGTRTLISDPTGPMTVVAATVVSMSLAQGGDLQNAWPLIVGTFVMAGIFQMVFGLLDIGKFVKYMPYPVLSGFMAGIGIIIISVQIFPLLGHESPSGFLNIIMNITDPIQHVNSQALLLGGITLAMIYTLPLISKKIPAILVALISCTAISILFDMDVPLIGSIPRELPALHLSELMNIHYSDLHLIITPALMLGGLGVIDSLLTSVVADNITKTKHNSKWTVIGQGVGNIVSGLFGGIPGAGATMGTVTNIKAGAQSRLSGVMKGVFLLLIMVTVADYIEYIPMSVLAAILITIGVGIIDYKGVKMLLRVPKQDALVWGIVLIVTLFDNLLDAVGIGFALASVLFIARITKSMANSKPAATLSELTEKLHLPIELSNAIYVKNLDGPLFFGFADQFRERCRNLNDSRIVILNLEHVPFLDQSGIITLELVIEEWHNRGIQVYLVSTNNHVAKSLHRVKLIPSLIRENQCFDTLEECIVDIQNQINTVETVNNKTAVANALELESIL